MNTSEVNVSLNTPLVCSNYSLCEVTVENEDFVKTKRLPEQMASIPDRMTLKARYYVKNNMATEALVPDEIVPDLIKVGLSPPVQGRLVACWAVRRVACVDRVGGEGGVYLNYKDV